jgi:CheY-like chemotaxis protein
MAANLRISTKSTSKHQLVILDDEATLLSLLVELLRDEFEIVPFTSSVEALAYLLGDVHPDVVLCDIAMPFLDGPALARRAVEARDELRRAFVFMTGGGDREVVIQEEQYLVLSKPLAFATLAHVLAGVAVRTSAARRG